MMASKKAKNGTWKIGVPTYTHMEFELGDTAADIQKRREEREKKERGAKRLQEEEIEQRKVEATQGDYRAEGGGTTGEETGDRKK